MHLADNRERWRVIVNIFFFGTLRVAIIVRLLASDFLQ